MVLSNSLYFSKFDTNPKMHFIGHFIRLACKPDSPDVCTHVQVHTKTTAR